VFQSQAAACAERDCAAQRFESDDDKSTYKAFGVHDRKGAMTEDDDVPV
jgi:hypothetical protein